MKKETWNLGRSRGLEKAKLIIGDLKKEVALLLKNKKKIRILEVGCGYGRVLLELKKIFGNRIETYGTNKEPAWNIELIKKFGIAEKIFSKGDIKSKLPKFVIADADKGLPYPSNYFDLVFSQRVIQYISDKAKYLEELNRIVKKDGLIFTDIQDGSKKDKPIELQHRWEIWNKDKRVSIYQLLSKKKNIHLYKEKGNPQDKYIKMKKDPNFKMNIKLISKIDLHGINPDWWGTKSIYILK